MKKIFHICTIANRLSQYRQMKDSFIQAGFGEDLCKYSLFDNSQGNTYDPYQVMGEICTHTHEPYIIFCHQDILLNQGDGFERLVKLLSELERFDPNWAIAGNAGINKNYGLVARIADPNNTKNWDGGFPQRVYSLDENFLVIKSRSGLSTSRELKGFHFYGSDLCLHATLNHHSCYVIDFYLTHLSGGKIDQSFWNSQVEFYNHWHNQFVFCYIKTVTDMTMCLSRFKLLRTLGARKQVMQWFLSRRYLHPLVVPK